MIIEADLLTSLAEIAGVFVGFGALIGVVNRAQSSDRQLSGVQGIVVIGLLVVVAAMLPLGIAGYGLDSGLVWRSSSALFLVLIWVVIFISLRSPVRSASPLGFSNNPIAFTVFWLLLELPIQVPLVLATLGVLEHLAPAFYSTALILNLFQGALLLALLVFSPPPSNSAPGEAKTRA